MTSELSTAAKRRRVLQILGSTGTVALAGCIGGAPSAEDSEEESMADDEQMSDEEMADREISDEAMSEGETSDEEMAEEESMGNESEGSMDDQTFVDLTGQDTAEILTREGGETESAYIFEPAFIRVDAGTTIVWENTGGGVHTVTSTETLEDRSNGGAVFDEGLTSEGDTVEWTAEETGTQHYYCSPHSNFMFGSIEIV